MSAVRHRSQHKPPAYPTSKVYGAILTLRRRGERVENYCRDRRLHVIGNAILGDAELLARAAGTGGLPDAHPDAHAGGASDYSRPSTPSTSRSAQPRD